MFTLHIIIYTHAYICSTYTRVLCLTFLPQTDSGSDSSFDPDMPAVDVVSTSSKVQQDQAVLNPTNNMELDDIGLQDYGTDSELASFQNEQHGEFISVRNDFSKIHSSVQLIVSDDTSSDQDILTATSKALSLMKDRMVDLQLSASMPSHLQPIVESTLTQMTNVEKYMQKVDELLSHYGILETWSGSTHRKLLSSTSSNSRRRVLSNAQHSSSEHHFRPSHTTKADYHLRAKNGNGQPLHLSARLP